MVSTLASIVGSSLNRGFQPLSWVPASVWLNHRLWCWYLLLLQSNRTIWRSKGKDWLARNRDNVYKWNGASIIKTQLSVLVYYKADIIIISSHLTCSRYDMADIFFPFGVKAQSITQSQLGYLFSIFKFFLELCFFFAVSM